MSKFETVNTLMYQYLIEGLEEDIKLAKQRVEMLEADDDFDNAIGEQKQVMKWEDQLSHLKKYLENEEKSTCNRPSYIEISHFDNFGNKKTTDELNSYQLDGDEYYYKSTGIKLNDWKELEEGKLYIINNLTLEKVGDKLMSKYPLESMWYELNEDYEGDTKVFEWYGNKEVYFKN